MTDVARLLAFYLPQFHPIPENDEWWGKGFTEWRNVTRARPLFDGHYQPHLPANLGFYDLRVPQVREAQARLAARFGIEGFCYWHYWFNGRRVLQQPFEAVLASGRPDFPFCLAWANETWSRRWLGEERDILLSQDYSPQDDLAHARYLARAWADPRYVRFEGRPVFLVYRPSHLPDPIATTELFRRAAAEARAGDPYLIGINSHDACDARTLGFDATLDFEPSLGVLPNPLEEGLKIYDYGSSRAKMQQDRPYPTHPCVFVSWDNTPRRGDNGIVFINSNPQAFEAALRQTVHKVADRPPHQRLVFLNAWNEWAEGNHLEPDQRHGTGYLEAVARVVRAEVPTSTGRTPL